MTLNTFTAGVNTSFSSQLNSNFIEAYTLEALNLIRQLQDRSVTFSKGGFDWWGEAYNDSDGRMNSVDTTLTTNYFRTFDSTNLGYGADFTNTAASDTLHDPDSFTNPTYAFDSNLTTQATKGGDGTHSIGKTFSSKSIDRVYWKAEITGGTGTRTLTVELQSYNGSSWSTVSTLLNAVTGPATWSGVYAGTISSVQGLRLRCTHTSGNGLSTAGVYELQYNTVGTAVYTDVVMNIPSGTFSSTISKSILVPLIYYWEAGADLTYKLTNAGEDTGWLPCGTTPMLSEFTAFTSEPTKLTVRLTPKSSSPTTGYPTISGCSVRAV